MRTHRPFALALALLTVGACKHSDPLDPQPIPQAQGEGAPVDRTPPPTLPELPAEEKAPAVALPPAPPIPPTPPFLPEVEAPKDNPTTPEKVALGYLLFFDKRMSKDDSMACAEC